MLRANPGSFAPMPINGRAGAAEVEKDLLRLSATAGMIPKLARGLLGVFVCDCVLDDGCDRGRTAAGDGFSGGTARGRRGRLGTGGGGSAGSVGVVVFEVAALLVLPLPFCCFAGAIGVPGNDGGFGAIERRRSEAVVAVDCR